MAESTTHTTTTTTTVERREVVSVGVNIGFLKTPIGILMLVELFVGLLAWALLVSIPWFHREGELGFAAFGFIFSWLATLILFFTFVTGLHGSVCSNLPWGMIQWIVNAIFALLCFISAICVAVNGSRFANWGASAAFGFILFALYVVSLLLTYRKAYGRFPWQNATGAPANT
ncbi:plasmolipin-like [Styela clava]|uniref:MARVEL domain-containing protein 1-like n=1 Tax=Styela clava TaxID=7725 RepID=UPI001939413B|nr:MARVEL domain-containing protein 1-like [Styela clava]